MQNTFQVIKNNGQIQTFDEQKIKGVVTRIGGNDALARHIIQKLVAKYKGKKVLSGEIYSMVRELLYKEKPAFSRRYNLRKAILKLGPTGYDFEKYVAAILRVYGYKADLPHDLQGACVTHEVDVIIEKEGRTAMIEAKFRNQPNDHIGIKDSLSTWARYMDLLDGSNMKLCPHFDEAWIVTNARFSSQSLEYSHCKNMKLIGWNHPHERSFANMIDKQQMYPITVLDDFSEHVFKTLAEHNLMLCSEIAKIKFDKLKNKVPLPGKTLLKIVDQCKEVINPN